VSYILFEEKRTKTLLGETNLILVSFFGEFKIEDVDRLKKSASEINWE
jgi:hypothetical protein